MERVLIEKLADGAFHSGQELGAALGVSRTAVWKHLQKLEPLGIAVESVKGRGYRIPGGIELLDEGVIRSQLDSRAMSFVTRFDVLHAVPSTNTHLVSLGEESHGVVCVAEQQTGGRGRRGRTWSSPYGRNIYFSMGWMVEGGAASLEGLSLAVGIAVRRALGSHDQLLLKWPNDLLFEGRKLSGILIEMQGDPSGRCSVVIGIGINAGMAGLTRPDIDQPWADAAELGRDGRNRIVAALINQLVIVLDEFSTEGFAAFVEEWHRFDACTGKPVRLMTPLNEVTGIARGVAATGALRIETAAGIELFSGGEVSLRLRS